MKKLVDSSQPKAVFSASNWLQICLSESGHYGDVEWISVPA